ncbi:MAG: hypothetical protein BWX81_00610 [Spirochaetes bacterium ADurb.Bin110]|jgi:hypothetical protein|nr:MAG: hypothetical protein BWX81_00610 [Spirochaetes bacterium ADurb.Bin110]
MNGSTSEKNGQNAKNVKKHRLIIRASLLVIYVFLIVVMIHSGRRHTILIDNKDAHDGSYIGIDGMEVSIDNQEPLEYYRGDRDKAVVQGQKHTIKVELFDDGRKIEKTFAVPLWTDMVIIFVPKLVNGIEPWLEPFTVAEQLEESQESISPDEEMSFQSIGSPQLEGVE